MKRNEDETRKTFRTLVIHDTRRITDRGGSSPRQA